jgi:hypothetical protein
VESDAGHIVAVHNGIGLLQGQKVTFVTLLLCKMVKVCCRDRK